MPTIVEYILGEWGETERVNGEINLRVLDYLRTCGLKPADPWCGALLSWAAIQSGVTPPPHAGVARAWLMVGEPVLNPRVGDIAVLRRGLTWEGHVGVFIRYVDRGSKVLVLAGNQSDSVGIAPFDSSKILGFRRVVSQ